MRYLYFIFGIIGLIAIPEIALMQDVDPCEFISGGCPASNVPAEAIPVIANLFIGVAAGASMMFVIVGGFLMLVSLGEEGNVQKGKMAVIYALVGLAITLLAQSIVAFVGTRFIGLSVAADPFITFMASAVASMIIVFNSVFILMMVLAGFRMAFARGNADEFNKAKGMLIWAAIGAIIVNVARALVATVLTAFGV